MRFNKGSGEIDLFIGIGLIIDIAELVGSGVIVFSKLVGFNNTGDFGVSVCILSIKYYTVYYKEN